MFPRPLMPILFRSWEACLVEAALAQIREAADLTEEEGMTGQLLEWLCADWLARWGGPDDREWPASRRARAR